MHLYCMQHAAFTLARPEKQKTIRNRRQKQQRRHMRKHTARAEAKHRNLVSTEATQDTTHCTRLYSKIPNPRLCGGGRGGAKNDKAHSSSDADLLAGLQQLLQTQQAPEQSQRDSTRDASLLQHLSH